MTGCQRPCNYLEYSFIGEKQQTAFVSDDYVFSLWAVSADTVRILRASILWRWSSFTRWWQGSSLSIHGHRLLQNLEAVLDFFLDSLSWPCGMAFSFYSLRSYVCPLVLHTILSRDFKHLDFIPCISLSWPCWMDSGHDAGQYPIFVL